MLFIYVDIETRVPRAHSLRSIRKMANDVLAALSGAVAVPRNLLSDIVRLISHPRAPLTPA